MFILSTVKIHLKLNTSFRAELFPDIELQSGIVFEWQGGRWVFIAAGERDYNKERLGELFRNDENAGVILSFSVLDEKIHSTKQGLDSLADEISLFYQNYRIHLIKSITQGRNIYIVSDYGFVEN